MAGETFKLGDKIVWDRNKGQIVYAFMRDYGLGPFVVKEVEEVPVGFRGSVGHKQWVFIEVKGGQLTKFSGNYFKQAE